MLNFPNLYEASILYTNVFGMSSQTSKNKTNKPDQIPKLVED